MWLARLEWLEWQGLGRAGPVAAHYMGKLHAGHPPAHHPGSLALQPLLPEFLLDSEAERHRAVVLLATFGMVAAEGDELPADGAPANRLSPAVLGVFYNSLHLLASWQGAAGIAALAGMDQGLDAALDPLAVNISWVLDGISLLVAALTIHARTYFLHLVVMVFSVIAGDTQDIILTDSAAPARFHFLPALTAGVRNVAGAAPPQYRGRATGLRIERAPGARPRLLGIVQITGDQRVRVGAGRHPA